MKINFALAFAAFSFATAAAAVPTVYTSESAFNAAISGATTWSFGFPDYIYLGPSYTLGPVVFGASQWLSGYNDGVFGAAPYIGAVGTSLTVTSTTKALGLYFGSVEGKKTMTYTSDGVSGSFDTAGAPAASFIGFIDSSPITATFTHYYELDTVSFITGAPAVPEPASWAMLISGFGLTGAVMRRRRVSLAA